MNENYLEKLLRSEYIYDIYEGIPLKRTEYSLWSNELEDSISASEMDLITNTIFYRPCTKAIYDEYINDYYEDVYKSVEITRKQWEQVLEYLDTKDDSTEIKELLLSNMRWK